MQPKCVNLNELVADRLQSSPRIIRENVKVEFMSEEGLGHVHADPANLNLVLTSLFLNASNAMPNGGELVVLTRNVRMDASLSQSASKNESDRYVMLSVTDTGSGMDRPTLDRIFEPPSAAEQNEKSAVPALSAVHGIVKQSNGNMRVWSKVGEGTTFQIYFPSITERD